MNNLYPSANMTGSARAMSTDAPKAASELEILRARASNANERASALLERLTAIRNGLNGSIPPMELSAPKACDGGSLGQIRGEINCLLSLLEDCHNVMSELDALIA